MSNKPPLTSVVDENGIDWPRSSTDRCDAVIPTACGQLAELEIVDASTLNMHVVKQGDDWKLAKDLYITAFSFDPGTGTFTITRNDGKVFKQVVDELKPESIASLGRTGPLELTYINEKGEPAVIDMCADVKECETPTKLEYDPVERRLTYTGEDHTYDIDMPELPVHPLASWPLDCQAQDGNPVYWGEDDRLYTQPDAFTARFSHQWVQPIPRLDTADLAAASEPIFEEFPTRMEVTNDSCYEVEVWVQNTPHQPFAMYIADTIEPVLTVDYEASMTGGDWELTNHSQINWRWSPASVLPMASRNDIARSGQMVLLGTLAPGESTEIAVRRRTTVDYNNFFENGFVESPEDILTVDLIPVK